MISLSNSQNFVIDINNNHDRGNIHFQHINSYFLSNPLQNSTKTNSIINPKKKFIKRTRFSPDEDKLLLETVSKIGTNNWSKVSSELFMHSKNSYRRSPKQCKDRYINYLSPDINNKEWTLEEDQCLIYHFMLNQYHWSYIKRFLPGRSEIAIKNRFNKLKKDGLNFLRPFIDNTSQNPKNSLILSNLHKNLDQFNLFKENCLKTIIKDATKVFYDYAKKHKDDPNKSSNEKIEQDENVFSLNGLDELIKMNSDTDLFDFQYSDYLFE